MFWNPRALGELGLTAQEVTPAASPGQPCLGLPCAVGSVVCSGSAAAGLGQAEATVSGHS